MKNYNTQRYTSILMVAMLVISMSVAFVGIGAADTTDLEDGDRYWVGQDLEYENTTISEDDNQTITSAEVVTGDDDSTFVRELNPDNGNVSIDTSKINVSEYDTDSYELVYEYENTTPDPDETGTNTVAFDLSEQTLDVEPEDVRVDNEDDSETTLEVNSNRNSFDVNVSSDSLNDEDLASVFGGAESNVEDGKLTVDATNDIPVDFDGIDSDEYEFSLESVDTDANASTSVTVADPGDSVVEFNESVVSTAEGDVAELTIDFTGTDKTHVVVGDEDDFGYELAFDVEDTEDNEEVTVDVNTYLMGQSNDSDVDLQDIVTINDDSEGDVTVDSETELNERQLASSSYDMSAFVDSSSGDETDVGTFDVTERTSTGVTPMVLPGDTDISDYEDVEDVATESQNVAEDDYLVLDVEMNGIYGHFDDDSTLTSTATDNHGLYTEIIRDAPNSNDELDVGSVSDIYTNSDAGSFYVVMYVNESDFAIDSDYDVEVGLTQDNPYIEDEDEEESVETSVSTEKLDTEFIGYNEDDVIEYPAGDEIEITADTNVADGTESDLTIRMTGDSPDIESQEVVSEDGEFTATFDGTEFDVGDEFTVEIQGQTDREDALIVESTDDESTDDESTDDESTDDESTDDESTDDESTDDESTDDESTDDESTDDESTDDESTDDESTDDESTDDESTDDESTDDESTDDDTPGFGAIVALVAVFASALLALRRDN